MSGCGILTNGKGTRREYCEFSLDELQVSWLVEVYVHLMQSNTQDVVVFYRREIT